MKKIHIVLLVTVLIIPIFVSHVYAQTLYVDSRIGDMDKIDESKYRATGVSILRNSDGELISVARVDATRYLDDPIVDKFLKSNPDFLIKQGTVNGERVSLHEIEANYLYPECLEEVFDVIGYKNECAWYHRAYVTMLGVNDEKGESHTIFRGLNHVFTVKSLDNVKTIWHIISKG
tara:strand:- start:705 stop:1232 length:528 start_codon:yes stop_codon:yes gene_type:complete